MKTKNIYTILFVAILILGGCYTNDDELLVAKENSFSSKAPVNQLETFLTPHYNLLQITDINKKDESDFSNLIIGREF